MENSKKSESRLLLKEEIDAIAAKVEKENTAFANKFYLDTLTFPAKIIGRKTQAEALVRFLLVYKYGYVVPLISVYGRSGSGKSTIVKSVCQSLDDISYSFVNLRIAKTVFGAANLILEELGQPILQSAQGLNLAVEKIGTCIESKLEKENKKLFVLVLEEYDVIFYDKRSNPSDFVYKLITLEENLRVKGFQLCVITISNNALDDYELDDRVRSRIGNSDVFFEPYSKENVLEILQDRASIAFSEKVDDEVLEKCADLSSQEHGDMRRAIDLLRVAAELAGKKEERPAVSHVEAASSQLQKDRLEEILKTASRHMKIVSGALARLTFLTDKDWHSTFAIHKQYCKIIQKYGKDLQPVSYRRVSELLKEIENTGIAVSHTSSCGRHGYGTQYKLTISPEMIGNLLYSKWWSAIVQTKAKYYDLTHDPKCKSGWRGKYERFECAKDWKKYVDCDW